MGYYTNFRLSVDEPKGTELWEKLDNRIRHGWNDYPYFEEWGNEWTTDSIKWYEHKEDMIELSKEFPTVLFTLNGDGEERGDLWQEYYLNGQIQVYKADISFPAQTLKEVS